MTHRIVNINRLLHKGLLGFAVSCIFMGNIETYGMDLRIYLKDSKGVCSAKNIEIPFLTTLSHYLVKKGLDDPDQKIVGVVIPEGEDSIDEATFCSCKDLKMVVLPTTLTHIGANAFTNCKNLKIVDFGTSRDSNLFIGKEAFAGCKKLERISFPGDCNLIIDDFAFFGCTNLSEVIFPTKKTVEKIGVCAFAGCKNLEHKQVRMLGNIEIDSVIANTPPAKLPADLETKLTNAKIIESTNLSNVKEIGALAFWGCKELKEIHVKSTAKIADNAFADCENLKSKYLVDTKQVEDMPNTTFRLQDIPDFFVVQRAELQNELKIPYLRQVPCFSRYALLCHCLLQYNGNQDPEKLYTLNTDALCALLSAVIEHEALCPCYSYYSDYSSSGRSGVVDQEYVTLKQKFLDSISAVNCEGNIDTIDAGMFSGCTKLSSITFPEMLKTISYRAFAECKNLTSIHIPDAVKICGTLAFKNCTALKEVRIPWNADKGLLLFEGCTALTRLTISGDNVNIGKKDLLKLFGNMGVFKLYVRTFPYLRPSPEVTSADITRFYYRRSILQHIANRDPIYKPSIGQSHFTLIIGNEDKSAVLQKRLRKHKEWWAEFNICETLLWEEAEKLYPDELEADAIQAEEAAIWAEEHGIPKVGEEESYSHAGKDENSEKEQYKEDSDDFDIYEEDSDV